MFIELPEEDKVEGMCGEMLKSMYGTRDAAKNWENCYSEFMEGIGMMRGKTSACTFWSKDKDIRAVVHGDDFTLCGVEEDLARVQSWMKCWFEIKVRGVLGLDAEDDKEISILGRIVRWKSWGIEFEADPKHRKKI